MNPAKDVRKVTLFQFGSIPHLPIQIIMTDFCGGCAANHGSSI